MDGFASLLRSIERLVGFKCSNYKEDYIKRRILSRMRLTNTADYEAYHKYLLGLPGSDEAEGQKIVVLMPDTTGGSNIGIIVDDVHSVIQVRDTDIERINEGITSSISSYVKGIIKIGREGSEKTKTLIIWLDVQKVINDLGNYQNVP